MLTEADIFQRLTNTEDSTVERKVRSDFRDCRKTVVAFANSLPVGDPGIVFVGVDDNGNVESSDATEKLQMKISEEINRIFPPIFPQILTREKDGKKFIVIIVHGSGERPHFAGHSYIREDSKSVPASQSQFNNLIAQRNSKTAEILKWKGKNVTVEIINIEELRRFNRVNNSYPRLVYDCNQFFVTLEEHNGNPRLTSISLRRVEICYDHIRPSLTLEIYPF
jgi:predicted HTH transcriptional regulator